MLLLRDTYQRRDYKKLIEQLREYANEYEIGTPTGDCFMDAAEAIEELEDEVYDWKAYGKWILDEGRGATGIYAICSCCNESIYQSGNFNFCPNCGAKMEKE